MRYLTAIIIVFIFLFSCTKKIGKNPGLAYSDLALLDSISLSSNKYYKGDANTIHPTTGAPHGPFKLRFNIIGFNALVDSGKLPVANKMPDGSLIVKDVYDGNGNITVHAFMYKKTGNWIWGEIKPNKEVQFSVNNNASLCTGCHSAPGNRDLVRTFQYY